MPADLRLNDSTLWKAPMTNPRDLEALLAGKINLLLVDDDFGILRFLGDLFSSPIINVITATSYEKACRVISGFKGNWHTWVLDIDLGETKSGLDILREHPEFPYVLVLSGLQSMSLASEALHLGAMKAFDKIQNSFIDLADEVIDVASLGFILKGKNTKNLPLFSLLRDPLVTSTKQWAEKALITTRQLSRICELHGSITPSQYIALFNACKYLMRHSIKGIDEIGKEKEFLDECVAIVFEGNKEILQSVCE